MHEGTVIAQPRTQLIIKRPRLTRLLDEAGARVILLLAPAGYGKTTLAREWTEEQDRVGWYAGGPAMIDVAGLSVGIAEVLGAMGEPARSDMIERVRILAARGHDARGLAKAVSGGAPGEDWILVVDDYHHALDSEDAEAFFEELVSLTEFRLLITSRERPSWLQARKVVYGEAVVVEMDALAFTDEEALTVMGGRGQEIVAEARGWPAVIGLAAMRGGVDVAAGLPPDELYRFFAEDLFQSASPQLREALFLMALAGVDGAKALLGVKHERLFEEASRRGFLTAKGNLRVHPLLRGFLLTKMREREASERQGIVTAAVTYLADQYRWDDCLAVLETFSVKELILSTLNRGLAQILESGKIVTVSRWIALASREGINDPLLILAEAEIALRERDGRRAQVLGEQAAALLTDDLASRSYLVAALAAHLGDRREDTRQLCAHALSRATTAQRQADALWVDFSVALDQGLPHTEAIFKRLKALSLPGTSHALRLKTAEGLISIYAGRVRVAISQFELAAGLLPEAEDPFARTNLLHFLSYAYLLAARYEDALSLANRLAEESRDLGLTFAADYASLRRAGALVGMRRLGQARVAIDRVERAPGASPDFISSNVILQDVRVAISAGDLPRAMALLTSEIPGGDRPAFRGEVLGYRALVASALGDHHDATTALRGGDECWGYVEPHALREVAIAIMALQFNTRSVKPLDVVGELLTAGAADAVVMGYRAYPALARLASGTDLEMPMAQLLRRARDYDIARAAGLKVSREARPRQLLSPREKEVYDLLVQGRANHQIAKTLFISESTTKVHVRHIFEKLGVHSRAEAARMAIATEDDC